MDMIVSYINVGKKTLIDKIELNWRLILNGFNSLY